MPFQSIWPFFTSFGILIGAIGVAVLDHDPRPGFWGWKIGTALVGALIMFISVYFWALEGNEGYHLHLDEESGHGHGQGGSSKAKH